MEDRASIYLSAYIVVMRNKSGLPSHFLRGQAAGRGGFLTSGADLRYAEADQHHFIDVTAEEPNTTLQLLDK